MHPPHHLSNYLLVLLILAGSFVCTGQNLLGFHGGAAFGTLAGARAAITGPAAMLGNVAGITDCEKISWLTTAELPQGDPDLKYIGSSVLFPTSAGSFGLAAELHGFELYREQAISLGYARQILGNLVVGAKTSWRQLRIQAHGSRAYMSGEVGLLSTIGDQVAVGFSAHLPFRSILLENEMLPSVLRLGLKYRPSDHIFFVADLVKQSNVPESLAVALEYAVAQSLAFRIGVNTWPATLAFGVSYRHHSRLRVDTGTLVHEHLGLTPLLGIGNHIE